MDFTPLYHLRDRLKAGAIAGTALLAEDFRLPRALEAIAPFEAASPIFAKIGQGVRDLLTPDCADRPGALLDVLSLLDAVLTTQSAVQVVGEIAPIETVGAGSSALRVPHSVLSALIDALTKSGGGRMDFLTDTHRLQPEWFTDYRIKAALVEALGEYNYLADLIEEWLSMEGAEIVPLLMHGFEFKGKKMVRRIRIIDAVSGAAANDFYKRVVEQGDKEVQWTAMYALRHDESNADLLLGLAKTQKGAGKKFVHWAMSHMKSPSIWEYWRELADKNPALFSEGMVASTIYQANVLVADALNRLLDRVADLRQAAGTADIPLDHRLEAQLRSLVAALPEKHGPEICAFYRRAAALCEAADQELPPWAESDAEWWSPKYRQPEFALSRILPNNTLCQALLAAHPSDAFVALVTELYQTHGLLYAKSYLFAALLTKSSAECYEIGRSICRAIDALPDQVRFRDACSFLTWSLGDIRWNEELHCHVLPHNVYNPLYEYRGCFQTCRRQLPLAAPLDSRWYDLMMSMRGECDHLLRGLIPPDNAALRAHIGSYFYERAKQNIKDESYFDILRQLGWSNCEGLALLRFDNRKALSTQLVLSYLDKLPGSNIAKAEETDRLIERAEQGAIAFFAGQGIEGLREYALRLRQSDAAIL